MVWYWWALIGLQVFVDIGLVFFVWVSLMGSAIRSAALLEGMRAVAKNVDDRFAWNESNFKDVVQFLDRTFGSEAPTPPDEPPKGKGLPN
jgi:hypothetical protein